MNHIAPEKSFTITVSSNDFKSGNHYQHNSLSSFVNELARPIALNGSWAVGVRAFYCHNQFNDDRVNFINVSCSLITPPSGQINSLIKISRPKRNPAQKIFYEPTVVQYHKVNSTVISAIEIELNGYSSQNFNDECDNKLLNGQPTFLILEFVQEGPMSNTPITLHLTSEKTKHYPDNTAANFMVDLGPNWSFNPDDGDLEAAVTQVMYQPLFSVDADPVISLYDDSPEKKLLLHYKVKKFTGNNVDDYVDYLNNKVFNKCLQAEGHPKIVVALRENGKLFLGCNNMNVRLRLPFIMLYNMGMRSTLPDKGVSRDGGIDDLSITFNLRSGRVVSFKGYPDPFAFNPQICYLMADFVKYSQVGSVNLPLIKIFPLEPHTNTREYVTYNAPTEMYFPLSKFDLSTVSFSLQDCTMQDLPFANKNSVVGITLNLRRKKPITQF